LPRPERGAAPLAGPWLSHSPGETQELGRRLGELARAGDIFLLSGDFGTGKTCLTQGIARGLGITEYTLSPSFVLVRELRGRLTLYHMDLWRLDNPAEIAELGLEEYLNGDGVSVIEWAEKGQSVLPGEHLHITLEHVSETQRSLKFTARGARYAALLAALAAGEKN